MKDDMTEEGEKLKFSGERFIPNSDNIGAETRTEHLLRYQACLPFVRHKAVLDVASGEGYGSAMLAEVSKSVMGLDISIDITRHASLKYASQGNLAFKCGSATRLPFQNEEFDIVVSFETIEHLTLGDQKAFLSEVHRVLKADGIFIVSTPNKLNYNLQYPKKNEFHLHELTKNEFIESLNRFIIYKVYNQSVMSFSSIWRMGEEKFTYFGNLNSALVDEVFHVIICGRERSCMPESTLAALTYDPQLSFCQLRLTLQSKEDHIQSVSKWAQERDAKAKALELELNGMKDEMLRLGNYAAMLKVLQERCDRSDASLAVANDKIRKLESRLGSH
jgi:ubiquinone/menaquinone biosynthesis C-methylase UbiE